MVNSFDSADYHLYKKIILVVVIFLAAVKFMSIEHYWHIPLNTNQNLVGENLKLNISGDLDYINGNIIGMATITNEGPSIQNLSNGTYPVNLGISIVDPAGNIAYLDFLHQPIMMSGILKTGKSVNVAVNIESMSAYVNSGYGIRLEIVQENISWLDDTAQYYWFEPQQGP